MFRGLLALLIGALGCAQRDPAAEAFNQSLVAASERLIEAARPFGRSLAPALLGEVDPAEVQATYRHMASVVAAVHADTQSAEVPDLPGAQALFSAYRGFVEREVELVRGSWAEVVDLVGDQRQLPTETVVRIHSLIEVAGEEEDRVLSELWRVQDEFLRQNTQRR